MRYFLGITILAFSIYFGLWVVVSKLNINQLTIQSEDTLPTLFLPLSIINNSSLYLDEFYPMLLTKYPHPDDKTYEKKLVPFYLRQVGEHYVSAFPIVTALLALPIYFLPVALGMPVNWENLTLLGHITAALIVAISGGFLYLLVLRHFGLVRKQALVLVSIFLFCTVNFALLSQALWQHGTLQLFLILGLYFYTEYLATKYIRFLSLCGFFIGIAILSRPTAVLALLVFGLHFIWLAIKEKSNPALPLGAFLSGLALPVLFFLWYNNTFYQSIANQGYTSQLATSWLGNFPESFFGVWLSPNKGILVYSPIFLLSFVGTYLAVKNKSSYTPLYLSFALLVLAHTLIISFWKHWYGGWSFGYRMSSDILPFLVLLLIPFITSEYFHKFTKLFYFLAIFSLFVQVFGMIFFDGIWHAAYDRGFTDTGWLWSLKDSELAFNIRRVLVKLKLLEKACEKCLSG